MSGIQTFKGVAARMANVMSAKETWMDGLRVQGPPSPIRGMTRVAASIIHQVHVFCKSYDSAQGSLNIVARKVAGLDLISTILVYVDGP